MLLAQSENEAVYPLSLNLSSRVMDILAVIGAVLLVAAVVYIWAYFFRQRRRRRKHRYPSASHNAPETQVQHHRRRRHRRSHHPERPLNPTLAQSGGLPPLRSKDQPPPAP